MRIGLGFIGAGNHALHHMKEFSRLGQVSAVAVYDTLHERAQMAAAKYPGLTVTKDLDELLAHPDVDAVIIATPAETHLEITRAALSAGKHILLEKPMAHTPEDAQEIARLAAKHPDQILLVGHVERYNRPYMDARKAIDDNELGIPRFISASRISPLYLNNSDWMLGTLDTAVHDIDLMIWLMGDRPVSVSAQGTKANPDYPIYDHVSYQIKFANGGLAQGHIGWIDFKGGYPMLHNAHPRMFIAGTHGSLQLDLWMRHTAINNQLSGAYFYADDINKGYADYFTEVTAQLYGFIQCVLGNQKPQITPDEASLAVKVAHAAHESSLSGQSDWIQL
jgi:predicted dehydrogenase